MYFWGICLSILGSSLFRSSDHFLTGLLGLLIQSCVVCLLSLETSLLSFTSFIKTLPHSVGVSFTLQLLQFSGQMLHVFVLFQFLFCCD